MQENISQSDLEITRAIVERKSKAVIDASVSGKVMGGHWIITHNADNIVETVYMMVRHVRQGGGVKCSLAAGNELIK